MKIGASLRSTYMPPDVRTGARWMVERARAAAAAGLDSLFVGDHHAVPVPYYQNVAIMGRLLAEWDTRPAGVLMLLPLWQPVLAAEQIGTLASIAQGPFILQCAVGGGDAQFAAMGTSMRDRGTRFESTLETVRRLCSGDVVDGVKIAPVPPEPLQVWVGASAPRAVDRAARVADAFLIGPEATPAQIDDLVRMYRDARATHGKDEGVVAVRRDIHVGKDDDDAQRVAGPVIDAGYRGFDPSAPIVGGPETVARAFKSLNEKGCTEVVVRHLAEEQDEVLKSFERLATVKDLLNA